MGQLFHASVPDVANVSLATSFKLSVTILKGQFLSIIAAVNRLKDQICVEFFRAKSGVMEELFALYKLKLASDCLVESNDF